MKNLLKEPLVHFLLLGFLIFAVYYFKNDQSNNKQSIVIDDAEYNYLLSSWKTQWQREPTEDDIKAFIDQYLRQEVFYNEALKMNLDHNDIIVKRRLAQKMEAVSNDLSAMIQPPTQEELQQFYNDNKDLFELPASYSFQQVVFMNNDPQLAETLAQTKTDLNNGADIPNALQRKLSLNNSWETTPANEIYKAFGGEFASALETLPLHQWVGPITSGFGQHLVYISEKEAPKLASFETAKPYILKEFEYRTETSTQEKVYQDLLKQYSIEITSEKIPGTIKKSYSQL